ncbi:hypothetical protein N5P37_006930 [Trichoderma harzianum]|nr:hypothetical protein N5P37_006930 [Trichoderma harzianum]
MQLSALLALLPLAAAAALPQSRGSVEARAVEVETRSSTQDECYAAYGSCCDPTKGKGPYNEATNLMIAACIPGRVRCTKALDECLVNATEKRSVEEAPLEARYVKDECDQQFDKCCFIPPWYCNAKQAEKRSVEKAAIQARDNGSEATTACYGRLAACKRKGTPVAECYSTLTSCVQDVYQKFFA